MIEKLTKELKDKIASFDICKPYVWLLKLSEADFNELEVCLNDIASVKGFPALVSPQFAVETIIYIAEWYKRKYQRGNSNPLVEKLNLEALWINAGINQKLFLYNDDKGNKRWLYSIYVLGGLAIKHELGRNDNMRFLKGLCRIYHGENYTLENLDEASRAIAFRESIKRCHSLYEYMQEILNGQMPFDDEDLKNAASDVNLFVAVLKTANDEILKVKFRFEWVVTFSPDYTFMSRRLNVLLKPEEVGGGLHQYLRYDRVHLWGVPHPETQRHLYVYIRFCYNEKIIKPSTMDKPIITYLNHGLNDFVAFGVEKGVQVKHIPATRFNKIEIIVKDDDGNEYLVQSVNAMEYIQLWRSDSIYNTWTSTQNAQRETALLFTHPCKLKDATIANEVYSMPFNDSRFGISEIWNWIYIYDSVTFYTPTGREICLYNRIGYDQITTRLYSNTIHYINGGMVNHYFIDDPDISEEPDIEKLPLIFGKEDIIVRHFATKDDILNARPENITTADLIEYKQPNGRFTEWTSVSVPSYGVAILRITVKGKLFLITVAYLPELEKNNPIVRDFDYTSVRYRTMNGEEATYQDNIPLDSKVLAPTIPIQYGEEESFFIVDIYRPTLLKEVLLDGNIIQYLKEDETLDLPYIYKDRTQVNDFSRKGYQAYQCNNIGNIYTEDFINISGNPSIGEAAMNAWRMDRRFMGNLLDAVAPDCLVVCFGNSQANSSWDGENALFWNYDVRTDPEPIDPDNEADSKDVGVIFQDIRHSNNLSCNLGLDVDNDPWAWDDIEESVLKCFEVANTYGIYFFLMKPLRDLDIDKIPEEIYKPLLEKRGGHLNRDDKLGLIRLSDELGFEWPEFDIFVDTE